MGYTVDKARLAILFGVTTFEQFRRSAFLMLVRKAYKYRIYPNQTQKDRLAIQFGHARFVYNWALATRQAHYAEQGTGLTYSDTNWMLTKLKRVVPWLKEADSQALQEKLRDLDRAYKNFFEKAKNGTLPKGGQPRQDGRPKGYPRFCSKHDEQTIRYPQRCKVEGSRVYLPKVGWVRAVLHRPLAGKMKNCTVSKTKTGKYFVSIQVEEDRPEPVKLTGVVGVDLGLKHFAVLSTGEKVDHPQYLRQTERRLKRAQRVLSRRKKGSKGRAKARQSVAILHERIANQRQDFLHKTSHRIAEQFGHIKIENLNVAGMMRNHKLAKSISDSGWGEFGRQLGYKAEWRGGFCEQIDRFFASSKTCSVCGWVNQDLTLTHRFWACGGCGADHDRDHNAAVNIARFTTVGATESYAGGDRVSPELVSTAQAVVAEAGSPPAFSGG